MASGPAVQLPPPAPRPVKEPVPLLQETIWVIKLLAQEGKVELLMNSPTMTSVRSGQVGRLE